MALPLLRPAVFAGLALAGAACGGSGGSSTAGQGGQSGGASVGGAGAGRGGTTSGTAGSAGVGAGMGGAATGGSAGTTDGGAGAGGDAGARVVEPGFGSGRQRGNRRRTRELQRHRRPERTLDVRAPGRPSQAVGPRSHATDGGGGRRAVGRRLPGAARSCARELRLRRAGHADPDGRQSRGHERTPIRGGRNGRLSERAHVGRHGRRASRAKVRRDLQRLAQRDRGDRAAAPRR